MTFGKNLLRNNSRIYINRFHKGKKGKRKEVKIPNTLGSEPASLSIKKIISTSGERIS